MNLIVDIGNTVSKFFVFDGDELRYHSQEVGHLLSFPAALLDAKAFPIKAAIVSSVVDLPAEAEAHLRALPYPVLRFTSSTPIPIGNRYRTPLTLGTDRIAAAVGAWSTQPGHPLLIIDAGSCITFDFVSAEGDYLGGNIAPGLHARLNAINDYFPRLPLVEAEGDTPELGYDTMTAIRSGIIQGMTHEIQGYIDHFREKYASLLVFLTGGDANHFVNTIKSPIFADPLLVPRGLNRILEHHY